MLDETQIMHINFFRYGGIYTGDHLGMRYQIARIGEKPDFKLQACVWPEPFCFEKTPEEQKVFEEFEYSEDGRCDAVDWIKEQYDTRKDEWDNAPDIYAASHRKEENVI